MSVVQQETETSRIYSFRSIWDVLDDFVSGLEECPDLATQIPCVVKTVAASLLADTVFLYRETPGDGQPEQSLLVTDHARCRPPSASWHHRFAAERLANQTAQRDGYCWLGGPPRGYAGAEPRPQSTIMMRLSKTQALWIVAISFSEQRRFGREDLKIALLIRRLFCEHRRQRRTEENLTGAVLDVVRGLNEAVAAKSPFTSGHSERVARMAVCLGRHMKLSPAVIGDLYLAGLLHDVGKIGIRDGVLQKQSPLTDEEQAHVREHPLIGDAIVARIKNLAHLRPAVRNHHERFDGQGYPDRLAGDAIPLLPRIISVADACDAMMSPRPYRGGMPTQQVDAVMRAGAGSQWDPTLIGHFMACRHQLYGIYQKGIGDSVVHAVEEVVRTIQSDL